MVTAIVDHRDAFDRQPVRTLPQHRDAVLVGVDIKAIELVGVLAAEGAEALREPDVGSGEEVDLEMGGAQSDAVRVVAFDNHTQ